MPATPALVSTLSVVALALCYITLRRASLGSSSGKKIGDSSSSRRKKDLLKRRQDSNATTNGVCEGLVDLIRGQASEETEKEIGFLMSRDELSEARMVVVVIGPTSTKVYQVPCPPNETSNFVPTITHLTTSFGGALYRRTY